MSGDNTYNMADIKTADNAPDDAPDDAPDHCRSLVVRGVQSAVAVECARSLLTKAERRKLDEEIKKEGYWPIEKVRDTIRSNSIKSSLSAQGADIHHVDPELMMLIDLRVDYPVFITCDNVYTREELLEHYPFQAFKKDPEEVFVQQKIGVFPPKKHAMNGAITEYVAHDVTSADEEFIMIEDMVGRAARRNYTDRRAPLRIVKTKIYLAKDDWNDFQFASSFVRSFVKYIPIKGAAGTFDDAVKALCSLGTDRNAQMLAIRDSEGVVEERRRAEEAERQAKEAELRAKEAELRQKELELQMRELEAKMLEERLAWKAESRGRHPPPAAASSSTVVPPSGGSPAPGGNSVPDSDPDPAPVSGSMPSVSPPDGGSAPASDPTGTNGDDESDHDDSVSLF